MFGRAAAIWIVLVILLAALSSPSSPSSVEPMAPAAGALAPLLAAVVAAVVGIGARTSLILQAVRVGAIDLGPSGARHITPALTGLVAAIVAAGVGLGVGVVDAGAAITLGGVLGLVAAMLWPRPTVLRPTTTSMSVFLARGAGIAAVMAAGLGAVVGVGRFGLEGQVAPGAFAQVLAGTLLCDGLLGLGGFVRASTSLQRGLVVAGPTSLPSAPGPVLVALLLAAPTVLLLPSVLPVVDALTAVVIKVVVGAVVGGGLHLAGGLRGARFVAGAS